MHARLLAILLALALPLAGCLSGDEGDGPARPLTSDANETANETAPVDTGSPLDDAASGGADDPGSRAHKHDYWAGAMEKVLVDNTFEPERFCGNWGGPEDQFKWGCVHVTMGNGSVVYQGTSRMTVLATWNDPKITGIAMTYQDAVTMHEEPIQLTSGTPFEIPVDAATADIPHSKESRWMFMFYGGGNLPVGAAWAPIHITITIYRGLDLPLDPPHPEFWANGSELDLGASTGVQAVGSPEFLIFGTRTEPILMPPGSIVPPGTTQLVVHYTYKVKDPSSGYTYGVAPLYQTAQHGYWMWPEDAEAVGNEGEGTFVVDVEPEMTDSPYATQSQWAFMLRQWQEESTTGFAMPTSWFGSNSFDREIEYSLHFIALRGEPVSESEETGEDDEDDRAGAA